jgi:hypothetical protein
MNPDTQGTTKKKASFLKKINTTQPITVQITYMAREIRQRRCIDL